MLSLVLVLPALAAAAPPAAPAYTLEQWRQPDHCDAAAADDVALTPAILTQRYLDVLAAVIAGDTTALQLPQVCARFGKALHQGLLPPARPEPWNPDPPQPIGSVFDASVAAPFQQTLQALYLPESMTLSLSSRARDEPPPSFADDAPPPRDLGTACPLRLGRLADALLAGGFSAQYDGMTPPAQAEMQPDRGVVVRFERDRVAVGVSLLGAFAAQRRQPQAACVGDVSLSLSP
ncbi:MAG: hypothetical protein ABW002_18695 [Xanthomonas sp.]